MAKQLNIRGVIVPSIYDDEWFQTYIDKGIITPESAFRRSLDAIDDGDIDIHINSPGGSVFSAFEMANAVAAWRGRTGGNVTVTIGALAASAASAIAVMVAGKFRVHTNSKLMFHGASTEAWGGEQAMEDTAAILGKINADVMTRLTSQYDLSPELVADWFAEGRMGWLNATEAQEAGMVSEVIDTMDPVIEFDTDAVAALGEHGLEIAAVLDTGQPDAMLPGEPAKSTPFAIGSNGEIYQTEEDFIKSQEGADDGSDDPDGGDGAEPKTPAGDDAGEPDNAGAGDTPAAEGSAAPNAEDDDPVWQEGFDAGHADALAGFPAALAGQEAGLRREWDQERETLTLLAETRAQTLEAITGERDAAQTALATATTERDTLSAKLVKLLPALNASPLNMAPDSWESAMARAKGDGMTQNDAHDHCIKQHPDLHAEFVARHNKRQK